MMRFISQFSHQITLGQCTKEDGLGGTCSTHEREKEYI
jgi:hypothetical protein